MTPKEMAAKIVADFMPDIKMIARRKDVAEIVAKRCARTAVLLIINADPEANSFEEAIPLVEDQLAYWTNVFKEIQNV